jgi:hypothetical protein
MILHMQEQTIAKVGTVVTGASVATSFVAQAMPIVQFIAACIGVLVGAASLVYWVLQIREKLRAKK